MNDLFGWVSMHNGAYERARDVLAAYQRVR